MTPAGLQPRAGRVDVALTIDLESASVAFAGVTRNIGIGGLFVAAERIGRPGDELALTFSLPGTPRRLSVKAEVRWIRESFVSEDEEPPGMGLRFLNLSPYATVTLVDFLRREEAAQGQAGRS